MSLSKALEGLSMHDLREWCKDYAKRQSVSKVIPSDVELKRWLSELKNNNITINGKSLATIVSLDASRQGRQGTVIEESHTHDIYNYSLLKLGVHVGRDTALENHFSANQLAFNKTNHRGGRVGGLLQKIADKIFLEGKKSETGFVEVSYCNISIILSVVKPEFFVGAKDKTIDYLPDVLWGQMIKSNNSQATPAVQLSKKAQDFIVSLKEAGLNEGLLNSININPIPKDKLSEEYKKQSEEINSLTNTGKSNSNWAINSLEQKSRKR